MFKYTKKIEFQVRVVLPLGDTSHQTSQVE